MTERKPNPTLTMADKNCELPRISMLEERVKALQQLVDERDRLYLEKFRASEVAVTAAINASDKQTTASFAASEKAIVKAEEAQREYNVRSNEFRGQLDDQAKTLMPRLESQTVFKAYEDKLEAVKQDVKSLRESRSELGGRALGMHGDLLQRNWGIGTLIAIIALIVAGVEAFALLRK
jgi:hypothetical protein